MGTCASLCTNEQFSLELDEYETYRPALRTWSALSSAPQIVPSLLVSVSLRVLDMDETCYVYAATPHGSKRFSSAKTHSIVLERWQLDLRARSDDALKAERLPAVYKQGIVHFRTLYAMAHALPISSVCQQIRNDQRMAQNLAIEVHISEGPAPATPMPLKAKSWSLAPIATPMGSLECRIDSCEVTELLMEHKDKSPMSIKMRPTSPLVQAMLTQDAPARRPLDPGIRTPRASLGLSASPSLATSPSRLSPWAIPESSTASHRRRHRGPGTSLVSTQFCEPGALRTLFSTSARSTTLSPSSLTLTPPLCAAGSFDTAMSQRHGSYKADGSPIEASSVTRRGKPERIPRYARQPSYRQRRTSPSRDDQTAGAARSWSTRREQRRLLDRAMLPPESRSVGATSPSHSRVFMGPSPTPAFALPRRPHTRSDSASSMSGPAGDALDLVAMIDARVTEPALELARHGTEPEQATWHVGKDEARPQSQTKTATGSYDDILTKMTRSLRLQTLDEVFGTHSKHSAAGIPTTPTNSMSDTQKESDETAGRLDLSLG